MPRRDGFPTAEEIIAAQRAGQGPEPPPPPGQGVPPSVAAAAALAATSDAADNAHAAPAALVPILTPLAINAAAAGIIGAFDRFLDGRRLDQEDYVTELLEAEIPDLEEGERLDVVGSELDAERAFAANARARLDRDLPKALSIADRTLREAEVQKVLDRERRYVEMREDAVAVRALGAAEAKLIESRSPEGAYWRLSPYAKEHTLDCLAMGGKVWPWSVLHVHRPPLHVGCECELWTIARAISEGLVHQGTFQTADQAIHALSITEADFDADEVDAEMALLEARWAEHYGKGTTKGGQFRPKRGGDPGRVLRRRRSVRMPHMHVPTPAMGAEPVSEPGDRLDVRAMRTADLKVGDRLLVGDELERITEVRSPGLLHLEHSGLVYIDRETTRGVPAEPVTGEELPAGHDVPATPPEWARHRIIRTHEGRRYVLGYAEHQADAEKNADWYRTNVYGGPHGAGGEISVEPLVTDHGLPELPKPADSDRYELRYGDNASLVMWDREAHKPFAIWDDEWDLDAVRHVLDEHNASQREKVRTEEPPPPPATGGAAHDDVLKVARMRKPSDAGELAPGFHFDPDISRSEARADGLHLPPGFFKQSRAVREKVLFRHLGAQLADSLGSDGLAGLRDQDPHLASRKAVIDTYYALNSAARDRDVDLHPDAMRLVATAAIERGVPLHPDAAKLARRRETTGLPADEHPVIDLARQLTGGRAEERMSLLNAAGFTYAGELPDGKHVYRSHDQGATIVYDRAALSATGRIDAHAADVPDLLALSGDAADEHLTRQGFTTSTWAHPWLEHVHPDGRGVAIRGENGKVVQARAFTPTQDERNRAKGVRLARDPLGSVRPGASIDTVGEALRAGGWTPLRVGSEDPADTTTDFSRSAPGHERDHVRIVHRDGVVVRVGRPGPTPGSIVSDEEYQRRRSTTREAREAEERAREAEQEAEKRKRTEQFEGLRQALEQGKQPPLEGMPMRETVLHMRDEMGWQVVTARRRGYRQGGGVVYTLRSTNGDTLTFNGGAKVEKVTKFAPAPELARQRVVGRPPKDLQEFNSDALGRVDELAAQFGAVGEISTILYGNRGDHAAVREWNGTMVMGRGVKPSITRYLAKRAAGEPTTDEDRLDFYSALQTVQHEINHGVTAPGAKRTSGSMTPRDYQGPGVGWEESLTEETAHLLVTDWLRSYGMTEVLEAVKRHPSDRRVQGVYHHYRESLRKILDDAGVPAEERPELLLRMKFQMTPKERLRHVGERLQSVGHVRRNMRSGGDMSPEDEAYYRMTTVARASRHHGPDWEPVVRADLSDVLTGPELSPGSEAMLTSGHTVRIEDVSPSEITATLPSGRMRVFKPEDFYDETRDGPMSQPTQDGRRVLPGWYVSVDVPDDSGELGGRLDGRVVEVIADGSMVKVETDDGLTLWYSVERLH